MTPLYIFDLDGTLALIDHRRHFVECDRDKQDWKSFYAACDEDKPNTPVIRVMHALLRNDADILIFSGRSDEAKLKTGEWLDQNTCISSWNVDKILTMRPKGNYTPDDELKARWYDELSDYDKRRLVAVFDDRQKVVDMWRSKGIACFQVAPGNF